ncbi:MAG TPA: hypothetical protein PLB89_03940 [Flavobacteriales bacterium]|nr:hypothetical protein [Flavobacteriales bacterium]
MKKMMMATVLLTALTTVNAQGTTDPAKPTKDPAVIEQRASEKADKRTETMTEELGLSTEQTAKVQVINERFAKAMMDLKKVQQAEDAQKERARIIRQQRDVELKAVLTTEQYEKMLVLRKEKKAEHQEKADGGKKPHNE